MTQLASPKNSAGDKASLQGSGEVSLTELPKNIPARLGEMALLQGIPFEYLVPFADMLPQETVRLFFLDDQWTRNLIDGAVSIGLNHSGQVENHFTEFEHLIAQSLESRIAGGNAKAKKNEDAAIAITLTGLLIRSHLIANPGLHIHAWNDGDETNDIPILRNELLSENVKVCIFGGVPGKIRLRQPSESLPFHVTAPDKGDREIVLRQKDGTPTQTSVPVTMRPDAVQGVLDITQIVADMKNQLHKDKPLDSANFAYQMVQPPAGKVIKT